jgi:hypothetical protein
MISEHLLTQLSGRVPNVVTTLRQNMEEEYKMLAMLRADSRDLWHSPRILADDSTIPVAYLAEPKERVFAPDGFQRFIALPLDANSGLHGPTHCFDPRLHGTRIPNPENPGGYVTAV